MRYTVTRRMLGKILLMSQFTRSALADSLTSQEDGFLYKTIRSAIAVLENGAVFRDETFSEDAIAKEFSFSKIEIHKTNNRNYNENLAIISEPLGSKETDSDDYRALNLAEFRLFSTFHLSGEARSAGFLLILRASKNSLKYETLKQLIGRDLSVTPPGPFPVRSYEKATGPYGNMLLEANFPVTAGSFKAQFEMYPDGTLHSGNAVLEV